MAFQTIKILQNGLIKTLIYNSSFICNETCFNETDHVRHNYFTTHENDYILLYINEVQNYKQMKNVLIKYKLLLIILLAIKLLFSQSITNYTPKDYGRSNNAQNWSIIQGKNDILYFGNATKILEFDGVYWREIKTPIKGNFVTSLAKDNNGNIFFGAFNTFGYIKSDSLGKNKSYSISSSLNENDSYFSNIWKILNYKKALIFFSEEQIFILENNQIKVIYPTTSFHLAFVANNNLFVRQREIGLMKFTNNKFELVNDGEKFKDFGIFGIYPLLKKNKYLIVTQEKGLFEYDITKTKNAITQLKTKSTKQLNKSLIFGGILLNNKKIALNTAQNGIIIINQNGEINKIINIKNGLKDNDVKAIYQDNNNNIWAALNTGISIINYSSPINTFNTKLGLSGNVKSIEKFNNKLFIGTSNGLFTPQKDNEDNKINRFRQFNNFESSIIKLISVKHQLLISSVNNLYVLDEKFKQIKIGNHKASSIYWSKKNELLFVIDQLGVSIYKYENKWKLLKTDTKIIIQNFSNIVETDRDNNIELWVETINSGLVNLIFDKNFNIKRYNYSGDKDGLKKGLSKAFKINNNILFGDINGLLKFTVNNQKISKYIGVFEPIEAFSLKKSQTVTAILQNKNKTYLCIDGKIAFYENGILNYKPFSSIDIGTLNVLYADNNKIWFGGNDGLVLFDENKIKNDTKININLRRVICNNDSVIFNGIYLSGTQEHEDVPTLDYSNNTLKFEFSSLNIVNNFKPKYSYKLENYDSKWSDFSEYPSVKYSNLNANKYKFLVKSKNIYEDISDVKQYEFIIKPPWYLTLWAYGLYVVCIILLIWVIIKLYAKKLINEKEKLEQTVKIRTAEIINQKNKLEKQKNVVEKQNSYISHINKEINDSINYAKNLQESILPSLETLNDFTLDNFVLFKPKDKVSGDFYWWTQIKNHTIITAADCTGHGVPGAFMSMLGISFLREIVLKEHTIKPNFILNKLRQEIITTLNQKGTIGEQKDGMDIALISIDNNTKIMNFAGANNPLYLITDNKLKYVNNRIKQVDTSIFNIKNSKFLYEIKGDKMPIAIYERMDNYIAQTIQLNSNDQIYMFSDGFADQFGGAKGKKLKYKLFKKILLKNSTKPMLFQKEMLEKTFKEWVSHKNLETNKEYEQIDDIIIIGIKI